jgi:mannose-1-phosphate guanylyltransferase / phosphomannomutase
LYGYIAQGYWKDIGSLNEYQDAHMDAIRGDVNLQIEGIRKGNLIVGEGTTIDAETRNHIRTSVVGKNCRIHTNAIISNSIIGDNCEIFPCAVIHNSVIWKDSKIGARSQLTLDVVGGGCTINDDVVILENVFIGDSCTIGKRSKLLSNIKIWPEKNIEDGSIVARSLVWEDRWLRELFTDARITGISNIEISPEFGAKLGAAFGAFVGSGSTLVTSRDADNVSRMINRAIMSGIMSAGVHCIDLRTTSIPIVRHELRTGKERGGIHVRKSPYDRRSTDIIFFDAQGKDLPSNKTKSIERLFFGEDFSRAHHEQVGSISFPERTTESYIQRFLETLDTQTIHASKLKMVIDYSNGIASTIFPNILGNLDVQVVALNAYLDNRKITRTKEEFDASLQQLAYVVTSLKYDIGCMLDAGAEKMFIIDEHGSIIDSDRLLVLMLKFFALSNKDASKIAVPISASGEVDIIAAKFNLQVVKTRDSHLALMDAATDKQTKFVGGTKGGFIFNDFLFASDSMYSIAKLIECIARTKKRIGELDSETPRLHFVKKDISCPWHVKGRIMRKLTEESEGIPRDLIEGIKLYPTDIGKYTSILLNPDRARPVFHIIAESVDIAAAQRLANEYVSKIKKWIDGEQQ